MKLFLASASLAVAAAVSGQDFYEARLRAGEAALSAGHFADAADELRIAAFGLLDRPVLLCEALAHLALSEASAGKPARADAAIRRISAVGRQFPECGQLRLGPSERTAFEALVKQRLSPAEAEPLLGTGRIHAPATGVPSSPSPTPAQTEAPKAVPPVSAPPSPGPDTPDLDRQPQLRVTTKPAYPAAARSAGVGGIVLVRVLVSEVGSPIRAEVARGVRSDLDQAALSAVEQWRFEPASKAGRAVAAWMTVAVPFDASRP